MKLETTQFGTLDFDEDAVIHFPGGLLGFENLSRFLLIDQDEIAPLRWLQPIDEGALAFTVLDPGVVFPGYNVPLSREDRTALGLEADEQPLILVLVTVPEDPQEMTANMLGPLVVNPRLKRGRQVVLHDTGYAVRQRLIPAEPVPV